MTHSVLKAEPLADGVLAAARDAVGLPAGARIVADEEVLALDPGAHDLVIHALALHWANDPVGQLVQCRRALRPDGLFVGVLFGGRTLSELRAALAEAESRLTGGLSARVLPMGDEPADATTDARLWLVEATRVVLANGLELLGVSAPERM